MKNMYVITMGYHYRALEKLCLKRMSVKDEDLEILADSFPYFKELVLVCCDGFGTSGLAMIANKCRVFSQDIPTDVVVEVGEASFNLHKVKERHSSENSIATGFGLLHLSGLHSFIQLQVEL